MNAISPVHREFIPSPQQLDYFAAIETTPWNIILEAVAGAGKTETLARSIILMTGTVEVIMFNKDAAKEFKDRVKRVGADRQGVFVSTCHSVGFNILRRAFPDLAGQDGVNEKKVANILEGMAERDPEINGEALAPFVTKLVSLGKQMLAGVDWQVSNTAAWLKLASKFGVDQELPEVYPIEAAIEIVKKVFETSGKLCTKVVDFDDMIWAPIAYKCRFFGNDWVLIDEAQDTNPARRRLAKLLLKRNGRLVAVGDSRQAIYGFTGADSDALDLIGREFNCKRLPLSVTYRCPQEVVSYVHQWVNHIQAHPSAPMGEVIRLQPAKAEEGRVPAWFKSEQQLASTSAILCRYNAPLIKTAYALLGNGIACKVEGRDIGKGLTQLVKRWKVKSLDALEAKLEGWLDKEVAKAKAVKSETREQAARDKVECIMVFVGRCRDRKEYTVSALEKEIESLFADNITGILTLASGHKSKGREWPTVYWLEQSLKNKRDLSPEEQVAEDNIKYVIGTRAIERLVLVGEGLQ